MADDIVQPQTQVVTPAAPATPAVVPTATSPAANPMAQAAPVAIPAKAEPVATPKTEVMPFEKTGNATVDAVVAGFHKAGGNVDALAEAVMSTGKVDAAAKAALEKAYGSEVAGALVTSLERDLASHKADSDKARADAHGMFGGSGQFDAAMQWASENLDAGIKDMLNVGLAKGGKAMELSINHLKALMSEAGQTVTGNTFTPGTPEQQGFQPIEFDAYTQAKSQASRLGLTEQIKVLEDRARKSIDFYSKQGIRWQATRKPK